MSEERTKLLEKRVNLVSRIVLTLYRAGVTRLLDRDDAAEVDRLVAQLIDTYGGDPRRRTR